MPQKCPTPAPPAQAVKPPVVLCCFRSHPTTRRRPVACRARGAGRPAVPHRALMSWMGGAGAEQEGPQRKGRKEKAKDMKSRPKVQT